MEEPRSALLSSFSMCIVILSILGYVLLAVSLPAVLHLVLLHLQSEQYHLMCLLPHMGGCSLDCLSICSQAGPQISARSGQITEPKQDAANKSSVDAPDGLKPGSGADPVSRDTPPQLLASPKDHNPHSCSGLRDHSLSVSASLRGVGGLEGISRQQLQTLPRRQRMPGDWSTVRT